MPLDPTTPEPASSRRGVLLGVGLVGLVGTLTGCGDKDSSAASSKASGDVLAKTSDIPVGGGKIFKDDKIVVTQPTQGEIKAFSATCTHLGCTVTSVSDGKIHCPCHGSIFSASDGSVAHGPAKKPLPAKNVTVTNGEIKLA